MLAQGTDLYVVSEVMGHASIAITKDVYGHLVEGHKRRAAEAMSRALFGSSGSRSAGSMRWVSSARTSEMQKPQAISWWTCGGVSRARRDSNSQPSDP